MFGRSRSERSIGGSWSGGCGASQRRPVGGRARSGLLAAAEVAGRGVAGGGGESAERRALERTAPTLPVRPGHPAAASCDYVRHGTTTLFAALEVATGRVTETCTQRHRHQEFLAFLKQVAAAYPRRELHVVVDNLATHKHPAVRAWLDRHPRVTLHFTPTSGSWLNLVVRHEVAREQWTTPKEVRLMSTV